jgi:hypothetical protein
VATLGVSVVDSRGNEEVLENLLDVGLKGAALLRKEKCSVIQ